MSSAKDSVTIECSGAPDACEARSEERTWAGLRADDNGGMREIFLLFTERTACVGKTGTTAACCCAAASIGRPNDGGWRAKCLAARSCAAAHLLLAAAKPLKQQSNRNAVDNMRRGALVQSGATMQIETMRSIRAFFLFLFLAMGQWPMASTPADAGTGSQCSQVGQLPFQPRTQHPLTTRTKATSSAHHPSQPQAHSSRLVINIRRRQTTRAWEY